MLDNIREACVRILQREDFWILSALTDLSYEEGARNKWFARAVDSYERHKFPPNLIRQLRAGINKSLMDALTAMGVQAQYNARDRASIPDLTLAGNTQSDRPSPVEIKLLYDCAYRKQYSGAVPGDRQKLLRNLPENGVGFQVVFFTQLPHFHYPRGRWHGEDRIQPARERNVVVGRISAQFETLMRFLPRPTWPEAGTYIQPLAFPTATLTDELLRRRYREVFTPRSDWCFSVSNHLRDAQAGVAIWEVQRGSQGNDAAKGNTR